MAKRDSSHCRVQRQGKERDKYVCQICGSTEKVEGHNVIDYQYGGTATVGNIITLCHKCHRKVHNGKIDLITF